MFRQISFESFRQFTAGEHDPPSATFAFQPDIGTETRNNPFVGTARMLFTQAQVVVELEIREHSLCQFQQPA